MTSDPTTIERQIVFLYADDLAPMDAFYGGLLGLALERDQGVCRIYRVNAGAALGVCCHRQPSSGRDGALVTLVVADVDGLHARLAAAGIPLDGPPRDEPRFRIRHFFATDPAGYRVEVQRFLDPEPR